tara:strand:+ start:8045 stop:8683 length:639 start_codon:yes stop_codon:yes gene_type:complete
MTTQTAHESAPFWDRLARRYARQKIGNLPAYEKTLAQTRAYLKPTDNVLELGAGTSSTALLLAPDVARYTASDISSEMVLIGQEKLAQSGLENLRIVQGALGDTALGDGPFDAILAFNLLHLVPDAPSDISRAFAMLKPGGMFISKTVCLTGRYALLRPVIGALHLMGKAPSVAYLSPQSVARMMTDAGFQIVEANNPSGAQTGHFIAARKP